MGGRKFGSKGLSAEGMAQEIEGWVRKGEKMRGDIPDLKGDKY